jgi:hypothetical protein
MKRLRVFDLNTPWFWFTIFFQPNAYGTDWLRISLWHPHTFKRWWVYMWLWENVPDDDAVYVAVEREPRVPSL